MRKTNSYRPPNIFTNRPDFYYTEVQTSEKSAGIPSIVLTPSSPTAEFPHQLPNYELFSPPPSTPSKQRRFGQHSAGEGAFFSAILPIASVSSSCARAASPVPRNAETGSTLFTLRRLRTAVILAVPLAFLAYHLVSHGYVSSHSAGWSPWGRSDAVNTGL